MPRALAGIFLGYLFSQKGYIVLNLQSNQVVVSRDIKFYESIFPFSYSESLLKLFLATFSSTTRDIPIIFSSR